MVRHSLPFGDSRAFGTSACAAREGDFKATSCRHQSQSRFPGGQRADKDTQAVVHSAETSSSGWRFIAVKEDDRPQRAALVTRLGSLATSFWPQFRAMFGRLFLQD